DRVDHADQPDRTAAALVELESFGEAGGFDEPAGPHLGGRRRLRQGEIGPVLDLVEQRRDLPEDGPERGQTRRRLERRTAGTARVARVERAVPGQGPRGGGIRVDVPGVAS